MKFKSNFKIVSLLLVITIFSFSCSNETVSNKDISELNEFRANFLEGKNSYQVKESFLNSSNEEKVKLWKSKISHLISKNISDSHNILLKQLQEVFENNVYKRETIQNIAIKLAEITPELDFIMMFNNLDDYDYNGEFIDKNKVSAYLINELKSDYAFPNEKIKIKNIAKRGSDCNCKWTCHLYGSGASTSNCTETSRGCGFLWLQSCKEKIIFT